MKTFNLSRALRAALIGMAVIGSADIARADIKDYEFQARRADCSPLVKDKIVTVRLVNKKTGKPVPDAVIFATRLDMAPDGMPEMATKIAPAPGGEPGQLSVQGDLRDGRQVAALARREGSGRDRHGRKQARHHGAEMNRAVFAGVTVAAVDRGGGWRVSSVFAGTFSRPRHQAWPLVTPAVAQTSDEPIYYQDPDGRPLYSVTPTKTPDGRDYRGVPAGADISFEEASARRPRRRRRRIARSSSTATRWGWLTPRQPRRRIRWGWTTSRSTRARIPTMARSNFLREKSSGPASSRSLQRRA